MVQYGRMNSKIKVAMGAESHGLLLFPPLTDIFQSINGEGGLSESKDYVSKTINPFT